MTQKINIVGITFRTIFQIITIITLTANENPPDFHLKIKAAEQSCDGKMAAVMKRRPITCRLKPWYKTLFTPMTLTTSSFNNWKHFQNDFVQLMNDKKLLPFDLEHLKR